MVQLGEAIVKIRTDDSDVDKSVEHTKSKISGLGGALKGALGAASSGLGAVAGIDSITGALGGAIKAASSANETLSKSNTIFKEQAGAVEAWASGASKSFGLSKTAALDAAANFGNMFIQLGIGADKAREMSTSTTELAADFASFQDADITDVIAAQSAAFRGEYDSMQRFIPTINGATVEQRALAMSGKETTKELTSQDKALAVNALMFENAGDAMGDFDRTSGSLANRQRALSAQFQEIQTNIGTALLPIVVTLAGVVANTLIPVFTKVGNLVVKTLEPAFKSIVATIKTFIDIVKGVAQSYESINDGTIGLEGNLGKVQSVLAKVAAFIASTLKTVIYNVKDFWSALSTGQTLDEGSPLGQVGLFLRNKVIPALKEVLGFITGQLVPYFTGTLFPMWVKWINILKEVAINILTFAANLVKTIASVAQFVAESGILATMWEGIKTILSVVIPIVLFFGNIIKKLTDFISENKIVMYAVVAVLAAVLIALFPIPAAIIAVIAIVGLLSKAWDMIEGKTSEIWDAIKNIISGIPGFFEGIFNTVKDTIVNAFNTVLAFVKEKGAEIVKAITEWVTQAFNDVKEWFSKIPGVVSDFFTDAFNKIKDIAGQIASFLLGKLEEIVNDNINFWSKLPGIVLDFFTKVFDTVKDLAGQIAGFILGKLEEIVTDNINFWSKLPGIVWDAFTGILNKIGEIEWQIINKVKSLMSEVWLAMENGVKDFLSIGERIIDGIIQGIKNGASRLINAAVNVAKDAFNAAKNALGISSPSKAGIYIGKMFVAGITKGLEDNSVMNGVTAPHIMSGALGLALPNNGGNMLNNTASAAATSGSGQNVNFYGATIYAQDMMDAQRSAGDFGWAIRLRSRGLAYGG